MSNISKVNLDESWKKIRTNLLYCEGKVFSVTSLMPNEGKTTVTLNLAKQLSLLGKKVLVIDGDMKKPSVEKALKIHSGYNGLSEYLSSQDQLKVYTYDKNLDVVFSGKVPPNSSELISSANMVSLIGKVKNQYDYVLIDTPPVTGSIDCQILGALSDGVILVLKSGLNNVEQVKKTVKDFNNKNIKIVGTILNMVKKSEDAYYGYYY